MPNMPQQSNAADPVLARIIAEIESSNEICAVRFEPGTFYAAQRPSILSLICADNFCDTKTAQVLYSSSFGLYQIMGFNLYDTLGYRGNILKFWSDSELQLEFFGRFLSVKNINYNWETLKTNPALLSRFAQIYNGDASAYSAAMLKIAREQNY